MALDKQNMHKIILTTQKKVGVNLVKLSVVLRKPLEVIPNMIAINKYMYPDNKLMLFIIPLQIDHRLYISTTIFSLLPKHCLDLFLDL